jgi:hypothetical protein
MTANRAVLSTALRKPVNNMVNTGSHALRLENDRYFPQDDGEPTGIDADDRVGRPNWDSLSEWALEGVNPKDFPVPGVTLILNDEPWEITTDDGSYHSDSISGEIAFDAMLDGQISADRGMERV